jgi:hypothetical protein
MKRRPESCVLAQMGGMLRNNECELEEETKGELGSEDEDPTLGRELRAQGIVQTQVDSPDSSLQVADGDGESSVTSVAAADDEQGRVLVYAPAGCPAARIGQGVECRLCGSQVCVCGEAEYNLAPAKPGPRRGVLHTLTPNTLDPNRSPGVCSWNRFQVLEVEETASDDAHECVEGASRCGSDLSPEGTGGADGAEGKGLSAPSPETSVEKAWRRVKRRKRFGSMAAHALFLQHLFRRSRMIRPGCWQRGGMRDLLVYRPITTFACSQGGLAKPADFEAQRARARKVVAWYGQYTRVCQGPWPTNVFKGMPALLGGSSYNTCG